MALSTEPGLAATRSEPDRAARTCCWQVNTLLGGTSVHDPHEDPPPLPPEGDGPGLPLLLPPLDTSPPLPLPVICGAPHKRPCQGYDCGV